MKRFIILILLALWAIFGNAQTTPGYTGVSGKWEYQYFSITSGAHFPEDTLSTALNNSLAFKNGTLYAKLGGHWLSVSSPVGGGTWGFISGTLNDQTDLRDSLRSRLRLSDTLAMLSAYARGALVVKYSDTAAMLLPYLRVSDFNKINLGLGQVANALQVINNGNANGIKAGPYLSRPAPNQLGLMYISSDSGFLDYDLGTSYRRIGGGGGGGGGGSTDTTNLSDRIDTLSNLVSTKKNNNDSVGPQGYLSHGRGQKLMDSLSAVIATNYATLLQLNAKKDNADSVGPNGYLSHGRGTKIADSLSAIFYLKIDSIRRVPGKDSVYEYYSNGTKRFSYRDSIGAALDTTGLFVYKKDTTTSIGYVPRNQLDSAKQALRNSIFLKKDNADSVGPQGYASHGRVQKVADSLGSIISPKLDSIRRVPGKDSVYEYYSNGTKRPAFRDSIGGGSLPPITNYSYRGKLSGSDTILQYSVFNVLDYSGIKNDSSADITTALQSLINIVPSGSTIYIPAGKYRLLSKVIINKTIKLIGDGGAPMTYVSGTHSAVFQPGKTGIYLSSASDTAFYVNAPGVIMGDFMIAQAGGVTPTTSVGIAYQNGINARLDNMSWYGLNIGVDRESGFQSTWNNPYFYGCKTYGAIIRDTAIGDAGDDYINGGYFYAAIYNSQAGILYESGGGLKMNGAKFNMGSDNHRMKYCIDAHLNKPTVDKIIANCSFENFDSTSIWLHPTTGFSNVLIANNQICAFSTTDGPNIIIDGTNVVSGSLNTITLANNTLSGTSFDTAILIKNINTVRVIPGAMYQYKEKIIVNGSNANVSIDRSNAHQTLTGTTGLFDINLGYSANYTLTGVDTVTFKNGLDDDPFQLIVTQDGTGGRTLFITGATNVAQGVNPIGINTTAGATTVIRGYTRYGGGPVITSVTSSFTQYSIPFFTNANGLTDDNTNLKYYPPNQALLIGPKAVTTNVGQLNISTNTGSFTPGIATEMHTNSSIGAAILLKHSGGTDASPSASQINWYNGQIWFGGHDGSAYRYSTSIGSTVDSAVSNNSVPSALFFHSMYTTDVDAKGSNDINFWLDHRGRIGIGMNQVTDTALFTIGNTGNWGTFNNGAYGNIFSIRRINIQNWSTSGTTNNYSGIGFRSPIFSANNSQTYTHGSTLWIEGDPISSTNVTQTNSWALKIESGHSYMGGPSKFMDSVNLNKIPNKATPGATDSLLIKAPNGDVFSTPATAISVTGRNGVSYRSRDTSFVFGNSAFDTTIVIQGGGQNVSIGTSGSHMNSLSIYGDTINLNGLTFNDGFPIVVPIRGTLETGQTTFKGQQRTLTVDTKCEAGGYILVNSITTNHIHLEITFTDLGGVSRVISLNPVGSATDISTTGYYLFPNVTFRAKGGTDVGVQTNGTTGGSMNYDWEPTIKRIGL